MSPTPVHMGITGADETSFDFTGLVPMELSPWVLKLAIITAVSAISTIVAHTDPLSSPPTAPQNLIVIDTGPFNMLIGWDDITDETYYEAYYMSPAPVLMGTTGADETSFDFTGFGSEGTFTLGIKACNNTAVAQCLQL